MRELDHLFINPVPLFIPELFSRVKAERLLLLAGMNTADKEQYIGHLAALLSQETTLPIKEWGSNSEQSSIKIALEREEFDRILILEIIMPQDMGHDFNY